MSSHPSNYSKFFSVVSAGIFVMSCVLIPCGIIITMVLIINIIQSKAPNCLPKILRTWEFLPLPLRSLQPYDSFCTSCPCCESCRSDQPILGMGSAHNLPTDLSSGNNTEITLVGTRRFFPVGPHPEVDQQMTVY